MIDPLDLFIPRDQESEERGESLGPESLDPLKLKHPPVSVPTGLPLVNLIPGLFDAGQLCKISSNYLLESLKNEYLGSFDSEELFDYRANRPTGSFNNGVFKLEDYPKIELYLLWDESDKPFLMLTGSEPDLRWRALATAIVELTDIYEISAHVSLRGVPAEVPHTRTITILPHANEFAEKNDELSNSKFDGFSLPLSFSAYLEICLGMFELPSEGFVAHIPSYLARGTFPAGALALLRRLSQKLSLDLPLIELGDIAQSANKMLDRDITESEELGNHIQMLEKVYDEANAEGAAYPGVMFDMPTADEIGDRMERFLAQESKDQDPSAESDKPEYGDEHEL